MNLKLWAYVLGLTLTVAANAGNQSGGQSDRLKCNKDTVLPASVTVDRVVDGDTVVIRVPEGTYSVRMLGIDTPETHFMGKSQGRWGDEAAANMGEILPEGSRVRLEFTQESCDAHGRLLAHVFNGKMHANAEIVKRGLAVNYCVAPSFTYCREFGDYVANAEKNHLGMFSDPNMELPYDFRRRIEGNEQRSYVGNLSTQEVFAPGHQDEVPVAERVFFYRKSDIKAPYHVVGE